MQVVPNQLVELHLENSGGRQIFSTRVEDAYDDLVIVGAPLQQGHVVPIRVGAKLNVEFKLYDSISEGRFRSSAIVEKRFTAKNIPLLQLRLLGDWEKIQERMFVRVPVHIDALFVPLHEADPQAPAKPGLIVNLSGGGFCLRSQVAFEIGQKIWISFRLEENQIKSGALLARFVPTENGQDFGFAFSDIPAKMRQQIIKFVFKRQIDLAEISRNDRA